VITFFAIPKALFDQQLQAVVGVADDLLSRLRRTRGERTSNCGNYRLGSHRFRELSHQIPANKTEISPYREIILQD
jgi:hypothetical protein